MGSGWLTGKITREPVERAEMGYLRGVRIQVATGERVGVNDHALEDAALCHPTCSTTPTRFPSRS